MKRILKYPVQAFQSTALALPVDARVVRFAPQHGALQLWVEQRVDAPPDNRTFHVVGTGHQVPDDARYIASCEDGQYIWHLYEH